MQDAPALHDHEQDARPNLFLRDDTMFGVCEGLGEEFGFNPNFLRVLFAAGILWNPVVVIGVYLGLGATLALARWAYPKPRISVASSAAPQITAQVDNADNANAQVSIAA